MSESNRSTTFTCIAIFSLIGISLFGGVAAGDDPTFVEEPISTDETWTPGEGPYRVTDDITVSNGTQLTIEPGTTVEFVEGGSLIIKGELVAGQNNSENVQFTTLYDDASAGNWDGLIIQGSAELNDVSINKPTNGLVINNGGAAEATSIQFHETQHSAVVLDSGGTAVLIDAKFGEISDGTTPSDISFEGAGGLTIRSSVVPHGISGHSDSAGVTHLTAINNDFRGEISFSGRTNEVTFKNNLIRDEIIFERRYGGGSGFVFTQNTITSAGKVSISVIDTLSDVTVTENNLTNGRFLISSSGTTQHVRVQSNTGKNGVIKIIGGDNLNDVTVRGNKFQNTRLQLRGSSLSNIQASENTLFGGSRGIELIAEHQVEKAELTQNRIYWAESAGIYIKTNHPSVGDVTGTNISNNMIARNGGAGIFINSPSANICCDDDAKSVISENHLVNNTLGIELIKGKPTVIEQNHVVGNNKTGIRLAADGPAIDSATVFTVNQSNIYDNGAALTYESGTDAEVIAENNYWGAPSGPHYPAILPEGEGGNVSSQGEIVNINPWRESRFDGLVPESVPPKQPEQSDSEQSATPTVTDSERSTVEENSAQMQTISETEENSELDGDRDDASGSRGPGFGIVATLLAVSAVAILANRGGE
ncbi:right-handed parallel beta-helix repeat-containing protein [Halosimplex halophilum]|uniref:right-handed parallel beta-helix repeat-containing protein n=1 Tax=Halosimplex halophilum TaxID=2559572 RepID=UPI00107F65EA|nr:right-handed parallel beta-helix repeat-containing protein [Halosimplex halophilum]